MKASFRSTSDFIRSVLAVVLCIALVACTAPVSVAVPSQDQAPASDGKLSNDQLDSLVAPIALYPDPIMSQVLIASTYPLEIVQLYQWMQKNSKMPKDKMAEAVKKEKWDPSVQAMVVLPDLVKNLYDNISWTTDLGNAFLAQQNEVMDAVQRMRKKAKDKGALQSTEQQKVETKTVEGQQVIVIQPATTEVVYVPSYNPTVVYGPPPYPYPVYAYPPPPPPGAYVATAAISFGVGMMVGAAWGNNYCCNAGWGSNNNVNINVNNNYVNNYNKQNINNANRTGGASGNWQHNPQHRGGTPYPNKASAQKYGGQSNQTRQGGGAQASGRQQSNNKAGGQSGNRGATANNMSAQGGNRGNSASSANRGGSSGRAQAGNQSVSSGSRGGGSGAFGGAGSSRASAKASSSRGSSSMGGSRGSGGGSRSSGGGRRR